MTSGDRGASGVTRASRRDETHLHRVPPPSTTGTARETSVGARCTVELEVGRGSASSACVSRAVTLRNPGPKPARRYPIGSTPLAAGVWAGGSV
eukprot:29616-Prymnesium_polylepis.1